MRGNVLFKNIIIVGVETKVIYKKYIDVEKDNRVGFLLVNYEYINGNDYLVRLFMKEYGFVIKNKIDGWWYIIIHISNG